MRRVSSRVDPERKNKKLHDIKLFKTAAGNVTHEHAEIAEEIQSFFREQWKATDAQKSECTMDFLRRRSGRGMKIYAGYVVEHIRTMNKPCVIDSWGCTPKALWIVTMAAPLFVEEVFTRFCRSPQDWMGITLSGYAKANKLALLTLRRSAPLYRFLSLLRLSTESWRFAWVALQILWLREQVRASMRPLGKVGRS